MEVNKRVESKYNQKHGRFGDQRPGIRGEGGSYLSRCGELGGIKI